MADRTELVRQIGTLVEELGRVAEEEREAGIAETRVRIVELSTELEEVRTREEEAAEARKQLENELEVAEKRIETLVQKLKEARQAAVDAAEESQRAMRRQLDALQQECDDARADLEAERSVRKRLEKGASADERRLSELEKALAGKPATKSAVDAGGKEVGRLQAALDEALETVKEERLASEGLEARLGEASKRIEALENALKQASAAAKVPAGGATAEEVRLLTEQLHIAEDRAAQAQRERQQHAATCERRIVELEEALKTQAHGKTETGTSGEKATADKALPHELRPSPKPGAIFRPDWDLQGLPCKSAEQILQAWESVSNVQLSLEGYPSQYCAAFLVVLKQGKFKQLYILFNLKLTKHLLVCVPGKPPTDEAALTKAIGEGLKYLQMSGFELDKICPADVANQLGNYFLNT